MRVRSAARSGARIDVVSEIDGHISGLIEVRDLRGRFLDLTPARKLLEAIVDRWQPRQIWLFGSRVRGSDRRESDWDLLVVVPDGTPDSKLGPRAVWDLRLAGGVPADIVPCAMSDFAEYRDVVNTLAYEAAHNGVLIYGR